MIKSREDYIENYYLVSHPRYNEIACLFPDKTCNRRKIVNGKREFLVCETCDITEYKYNMDEFAELIFSLVGKDWIGDVDFGFDIVIDDDDRARTILCVMGKKPFTEKEIRAYFVYRELEKERPVYQAEAMLLQEKTSKIRGF